MLFYSQTTNSFYDDQINKTIPLDSVSITAEQHQALLDSQSKGQIIVADKTGKPKLADPIAAILTIELCNKATQRYLDGIAKEWGYDSLVTASSYANSINNQYKAEAEVLIAWRDTVWNNAYTIMNNPLPETMEAFINLLPAEPKKPVI